MDNKNDELKNALDEIFGDDLLEINTNDIKKEDDIEDTIMLDNVVFTDKEEPKIDTSKVSEKLDNVIDRIKKEDNNSIIDNNETIVEDSNISVKNSDEEVKTSTGIKKIVLAVTIPLLILLICILSYVLIIGIKEEETCKSSVKADGYKYSNSYNMIYRKNKLIRLKTSYSYVALTDEYKSQIEFIKNSKLPIVMNSYEMPGFTYKYDLTDNGYYLKGYLDFEQMDFNKLDKHDNTLHPINDIIINSKMSYKSLKKELIKQGYKCK